MPSRLGAGIASSAWHTDDIVEGTLSVVVHIEGEDVALVDVDQTVVSLLSSDLVGVIVVRIVNLISLDAVAADDHVVDVEVDVGLCLNSNGVGRHGDVAPGVVGDDATSHARVTVVTEAQDELAVVNEKSS